MVAEIFQYVSNHLPSIMTGLTMSVIGIGVYKARDGFFLFNNQFRGKYGALLIFLGTLFGASLLTPIITDQWERYLPYIPPGQLLGVILLLGMFGVNKTAGWNYFDTKSVPVYIIGIAFLLKPELLHAVA